MNTSAQAARPAPAKPVNSLNEMLYRETQSRPDEIAVLSDNRSLTLAELVERSSTVAAALHELGVGPGTCVGLYAEPGTDLAVGVWGILLAGSAYLPLAPEYPDERLRYMVEDSDTRFVVTQPHLVPRLREIVPAGVRIVPLEETGTASRGQLAKPRGTDLAYVIYTSGSTGRPKGVMIEHRSIVSQLQWLLSWGHLDHGVRILQKTPMSFDAAQWEILAPAVGATTVMGHAGIYRDPEALIKSIRTHHVTTLQCVPTLLQALLDTEGMDECNSLQRVLSGGEALSVKLARAFFAALPGRSLVNLYGPTECTINATSHFLRAEDLSNHSTAIPIGTPVDNTQCYVLDESRQPVPFNVPGELYLGGIQLARGYLNRPEQTAERFVPFPFVPGQRLYRSGDLVSWNDDGTLQFIGRTDNQIKLRGYRVELEEIALAVEKHHWVRRAAVVVTDDPRTGHQNLVACIELNPNEASLMDQGNHGAHHQSKSSKLQVKAQLSNAGLRSREQITGRPHTFLPGIVETPHMRREAFARKTYRFYNGGPTSLAGLTSLLGEYARAPQHGGGPETLDIEKLGRILRCFGQFKSDERLLPKYWYASPGALYATQMYLDIVNIDGLDDGTYYFHPVEHSLILISRSPGRRIGGTLIHFVGNRGAVEPVYKNNIQEVLEFEAGHMAGVFDEVLLGHGLGIRAHGFDPTAKERCDVKSEDFYLGTFEIVASTGRALLDADLFINASRVQGLDAGTYHWTGGRLERISADMIHAKHVIAINQKVYERAGFGITAVSRSEQTWLGYINLGRVLHRFQRNGLGFGFMSSGYSSKSGNHLRAAQRIDDILAASGREPGPAYFFLGGMVSPEQIASEGMSEDTVHMQGPAEMIKEELSGFLPDYMIPNRAVLLDALPLTSNGKVDSRALAAMEAVTDAKPVRPFVAASTPVQRWLADTWGSLLKYESVSVEDDFFESGGNSLGSVALISRIKKHFGVRLPIQAIFESPRLKDLAKRIEDGAATPSSRFLRMNAETAERPIFCWPGLGGYPMNLGPLAQKVELGRPFYGIQSLGINDGESPFGTIGDMAAADIAELRRIQPNGPYTLWGYSFGARVAFETAWQLEQSGETVDRLMLICPGNPHLRTVQGEKHGRNATFDNPAFVTILFSVFTGTIEGPELEECLKRARSEAVFADYIIRIKPELDESVIRRIVHIVKQTYEFEYSFRELAQRQLQAPITVFKAKGDDYSFIESANGYSASAPATVGLSSDHYSVLKASGVDELARALRARSVNPTPKDESRNIPDLAT